MASAKLTPEKKQELKNYILEELESGKRKEKTKTQKKATVPKTAFPKPAKKEKIIPPKSIPPKASFLTSSTGSAAIKTITAQEESTVNIAKPAKAKKIRPPKERRGFSWRGLIIRLVIFVVVTLLVLLAIDIFGIYRLNWTDNFSYQTARILNLPAGSVNGRVITAADYIDDARTVQAALINNREGFSEDILKDVSDIRDKIFNRLAMISIIDEQLKASGKEITKEQLDQQMSSIIEQTGGQDDAEKITRNLYQMSLDEFKYKVLRPLMAKDALQQVIIGDEGLEINKSAKAKAQEVLTLALDKTVDFSALAKQYTQDEAGVNTGGDLGWMTKDELSPELAAAVFSLEKGEVYNDLIKNNFGYHIIKVTDRATDPETSIDSARVSHVLILVDVDEYIKSLMEAAEIKNYLR